MKHWFYDQLIVKKKRNILGGGWEGVDLTNFGNELKEIENRNPLWFL